MTLQIRKAIPEDIPALNALFQQVDNYHSHGLPDYFQPTQQPARTREYLQGLITDQNVGLFVAQLDHQLAGFVHVEMRSAPAFAVFVQRLFAVVDNLGVQQDFRRQGIGKLLMQAAEGWAQARGAETVELNVYAFNQAAMNFYKALGYEPLSHRMSKNIAPSENDPGSTPPIRKKIS
jgi:ribosomal protein S18 acetylase RimI-like enzyme